MRTSLVFFDTAVVDMTEKLAAPVDVLFGAQLGGGTDIHRAVSYCQSLIARPAETIFVLISDLIEGRNKAQLYQRVASIAGSGVNMITLLALDDSGAPVSTTKSPAPSPRSTCPPSPARPTFSPTSWLAPFNAATSTNGRRRRGSKWSAGSAGLS